MGEICSCLHGRTSGIWWWVSYGFSEGYLAKFAITFVNGTVTLLFSFVNFFKTFFLSINLSLLLNMLLLVYKYNAFELNTPRENKKTHLLLVS